MSRFEKLEIIDLTQVFEPGMPVMPALPPPAIWPVLRQDEGDYVNANVIQYCEHSGTHLDSPAHIVKGGTTLESLPLDKLIGPAVVLDLTGKQGDVPIDVSDLETAQRSASSVEPGDVVLLRSDHSLLWDVKPRSRAFIEDGWPYLTAEAAQYLLQAGIRARRRDAGSRPAWDYGVSHALHSSASRRPNYRKSMQPKSDRSFSLPIHGVAIESPWRNRRPVSRSGVRVIVDNSRH